MADLEIQLQCARNTQPPTNDEEFDSFCMLVQERVKAQWPAAELTVEHTGNQLQYSVNVNGGGYDDVEIGDAIPGIVDQAWTDWQSGTRAQS